MYMRKFRLQNMIYLVQTSVCWRLYYYTCDLPTLDDFFFFTSFSNEWNVASLKIKSGLCAKYWQTLNSFVLPTTAIYFPRAITTLWPLEHDWSVCHASTSVKYKKIPPEVCTLSVLLCDIVIWDWSNLHRCRCIPCHSIGDRQNWCYIVFISTSSQFYCWRKN